MSSVGDFSELSTLIRHLQHHAEQSKLLQKVVDDSHRVLHDTQTASCISQSKFQE